MISCNYTCNYNQTNVQDHLSYSNVYFAFLSDDDCPGYLLLFTLMHRLTNMSQQMSVKEPKAQTSTDADQRIERGDGAVEKRTNFYQQRQDKQEAAKGLYRWGAHFASSSPQSKCFSEIPANYAMTIAITSTAVCILKKAFQEPMGSYL